MMRRNSTRYSVHVPLAALACTGSIRSLGRAGCRPGWSLMVDTVADAARAATPARDKGPPRSGQLSLGIQFALEIQFVSEIPVRLKIPVKIGVWPFRGQV